MPRRTPLRTSLTKTAARARAAAFAFGLIGAGLVTSSANAEVEEEYTCTSEIDDYQFALPITLASNAPEAAEKGEKFRVDPLAASATLPADEVATLIDDDAVSISADLELSVFAVPAGSSQGGDESQQGTVVFELDGHELPDDAEDLVFEATSLGEYEAWGKGADNLTLEAGSLNIALDKVLGENSGELEEFTCAGVADGEATVIDTVKLTEPSNDDSDQGNKDTDDTGDPNGDVPTVVNGGI